VISIVTVHEVQLAQERVGKDEVLVCSQLNSQIIPVGQHYE